MSRSFRVLLAYVHEHSGHHQAALALEKAFRLANPSCECRLIDVLRYAHPILENLIQQTYLEIIRKRPELWEYLYDNPWVLKNTESLRRVIHKSHSAKFKSLLEDFRPDAIICTQAFPCGIASDYKSTYGLSTPLYGVLTDYLPHSYWMLDNVTRYFVPTEEAKARLSENGIFEDRILVAGIPIDPIYADASASEIPAEPVVLVMGGSQGMGPIEKIVAALDKLREEFQLEVMCGKNRKLLENLIRYKKKARKKIEARAYQEDISGIMKKAALLVSKPGGLTIAQALSVRLPIIFINPIPGQEAKNASYLLKNKAAIEAKNEKEVALFVSQLLKTPAKIESMKKNMAGLAMPGAALQIARTVLQGRST